MLWKRILTAVVAVPIVVPFMMYAGPVANFVFFLLVALWALTEYFAMAFPDDAAVRRMGTATGGALYAVWGLAIIFDAGPLAFHLPLLIAFTAMFFFFVFRTGDIQTVAHRIGSAVLGIVYVDCLIIFFVALLHLPDGWKCVTMLLAIVWLTDTGGYFGGKYFGRRKLYEKVSPKKTWEGAVGGTIFGIASAFLFAWMLSIDWPAHHIVLAALGTSAIGQVGDLAESLLKRSYGIKDSGRLIPGHGGILDRIDAVMFGAPFFYYYITLLNVVK
ncbi:MAG: phosphatidate cytidylyltransferase [Myxococcales bacterium]|nr:MAG: phosphatidate cytidylyltransferase [Myxococcales bacterium]